MSKSTLPIIVLKAITPFKSQTKQFFKEIPKLIIAKHFQKPCSTTNDVASHS